MEQQDPQLTIIDERLTRIEHILPGLATKAELQDAIRPLATKVDLREWIQEEGERTRRYFDVVAERLEGHIALLAEGQTMLGERIDSLRTELKADIAHLDRRIMRLEAAQ
jgi:hypothetical protein